MSPQDQEELSPNLIFPELMASSLKHGPVRQAEGQEGGLGMVGVGVRGVRKPSRPSSFLWFNRWSQRHLGGRCSRKNLCAPFKDTGGRGDGGHGDPGDSETQEGLLVLNLGEQPLPSLSSP